MSLRPFCTIAETERAAAVASLRTVGGVYDLIALIVEHDRSEPGPHCEAWRRDALRGLESAHE